MLKKILLFFCGLFFILPVLANSYSDPQKPIIVSSGNKVFSIVLKSNPTTGYRWILKDYDFNFMKLINHKFIAPPETRGLSGAPGSEVWQFKVDAKAFIGSHVFKINFIYGRAWENLDNADASTFTVVTEEI